MRRITVSVAVSALGTWSYNVGIAVYAYQETHSTAWVAAATVGRYVPALGLTWFGSRWADRFPRSSVAVTADLVCAATMVALTILAVAHGPLVLAIALAAVSSGAARIQSSAALAMASDLVPESNLVRSMSLLSTSESVATAIGPALASLVLAFASPQVLFLINGVTFAVSAALLAGIRTALTIKATVQRQPAKPSREVYAAVWPLLATRTIVAVVYGADIVLLAVIATDQLGRTGAYGGLLAAAGAGGLLGALAMRRAHGVPRIAGLVTGGMALAVLPLLAFLLSPNLLGGLATQTVRGVGCVVATTALMASLQRTVPSAAVGQVLGTTYSLALAGTVAGSVAAPLLLHFVGLTATLVVFGTIPVLAQLVLVPALLRFDAGSADLIAALDPQVTLLRRLALFEDTSRWVLTDLARRATEIRLLAETDVVREGEESDALYVLTQGSVDVSALNGTGSTYLRTLKAPDYFGEIGLVHGTTRTATVTTTEDCTFLRIDADAFLAAAAQAGLSSALTDGVRLRLSATLART